MNRTSNDYQIFDWEGILFPLVVTEIISITSHYIIPKGSILEIYRDDNYKLKGILKGITTSANDFDYRENGNIKEVGFIEGETLKGQSEGRSYLIEGFGVSHVSEIPFKKNDQLFFEFECQIYIEVIELISESSVLPDILCDYYLCSLPQLLFNNITKRINNSEYYKYRINLDNFEESNVDFTKGYSSSWDFSVLNYNEKTIIIQTVEKVFLPNDIDGILIEYRDVSSNYPSKNFRKIVEEYFSFILGTHLQKIGNSTFNNDYKLKTCKSSNPWSQKIFKNGNINPVPLKNGSDRVFFEKMINKLFVNFVIQYEYISLSECLWKLWVGKDLPLGTNLPILSSGLECLIDSYLQKNNLIKKYTRREKTEYDNLIKEELISLEKKLKGFDFRDTIINKLENPYNFSIGEKMKFFFNHVSLVHDKNIFH